MGRENGGPTHGSVDFCVDCAHSHLHAPFVADFGPARRCGKVADRLGSLAVDREKLGVRCGTPASDDGTLASDDGQVATRCESPEGDDGVPASAGGAGAPAFGLLAIDGVVVATACVRYESASVKEDTLVVHEIYKSVQGESTFVGVPCTFVRLTGCNLRCAWCDTPQAFHGGKRMRRSDVLASALDLGTPLVELTGGEPLLQPGAIPLLAELCDAGRTVLVETSGEADVSKVDARVHKIMDLKAPGSRESHRNRWSNLAHLSASDEIKFVLADRADYDWMKRTIEERGLASLGPTLLASPVWGSLDPKDLVAWVLEDRLEVRVQVQLHKVIWGKDAESV